jgi:1-acyl-sn-glycerol-3-phosphate acyltransferase
MLDLPRLQRIHPKERPPVQRFCWYLLRADYWRPPRTEIVVEGLDRVPRAPLFIAMNHTDRYNYFPFQTKLLLEGLPYTATWVKGKYYQNAALGWFLDAANNIPLPSRGYVVSTALAAGLGRKPTDAEYRELRDRVERRAAEAEAPSPALQAWYAAGGGAEARADRLRQDFAAMMDEVMRITAEAMGRAGNHVLVFPEGTRRVRLGRGHIGLAQMAQHLGASILPVACNGSHRVYPGDLPISRGGRIVYRVGEPLSVDHPELLPHRVREPFTPFTTDAEQRHGQAFRAITDVVMGRIEAMLDPEHRPAPEDAAGGAGVGRFL